MAGDFFLKGRGGYKPTRNKDRYKPNKNKRPEYIAARLRGGWLFCPEISARRSIVRVGPEPPRPPAPRFISTKHGEAKQAPEPKKTKLQNNHVLYTVEVSRRVFEY